MKPFYQNLLAKYGLDKQTYPTHLKTIPPTTLKLNYESINNNAARGRDTHCFDYCVKDEVLLAKLFIKPFMAHFNALIPLLMPRRLWLFFALLHHSALQRRQLNLWDLKYEMSGPIATMRHGRRWNTIHVLIEWRPWLKTWDLPQQKKQSSSLSYSCGGSMVRCYYTYLKKYCFVFSSSRGGLNQNCILRPIEYAGCWRDTDCNLNVDIHEPNWRHKFEKNRQIFI